MPPSNDCQTSPPGARIDALEWVVRRLDGLSALELLRIMRARQQVFVVEQHCPYLDADLADEHAWHLVAWQADRVCAYARIIDPGVNFPEASIGRVITDQAVRGTGLGRALMARAIDQAAAAYPGTSIRISAQSHLQAFYAGLGFVASGTTYLEDGIPHISMLRAADAAAGITVDPESRTLAPDP